MTMTSWQAGFDDVVAASEILRDIILVTPMLHSRVLSERIGGPVYLKCENLQRTGSFKARGAYLRIARLTAAERARGVIAASAGNHAQGVAFAAALLGAKATVVMPDGHAMALAQEQESVFIHPFEHPDVIAGQGTLGLEIVGQCPGVRTIVVPVGGGGLAAGIAIAARGSDPSIRVVGVQAEVVAPFPASLLAGHPVPVESAPTMADGIAVARPGDLAFGILAELAERIVTVSEEALSRALLLCLERAKQVVEPAGAAGVAALLDDPRSVEPPVVAVLSGGNIDPLLLAKVLRHGLSAAGRYLTFRCRLPDRPGALATLLAELADLGANVLDVVHARFTPHLRVDEVEVQLQVETRGPGHCDGVIGQLRKSGYTLIFS